MDSQHRHDLEQNDLADALSGFGKWWSRWGNTVLVVVLIAAVSFTAYRYLTLRATQAHELAWGDLAFETSPQGLQELARTSSDPTVKSMAYLRAGDLQLAQALAPAPTPTPTPTPAAEDATPGADGETPAVTPTPEPTPPVDPATALADAAAMYEQAAKLATNDTIKANALLGWAAVAESQRAFDEAKTHYEQVIQIVGGKQPMIAAMAQARLEQLEELRTPVRFAAAPAAPEAPEAPEAPASQQTPAAPEAPAPTPTPSSEAPAAPATPPAAPEATAAPADAPPAAAPAPPAPEAAPEATATPPAAGEAAPGEPASP